MGLSLKINLESIGSTYPRENTVINISEIIKAIEDAVEPYGLGIFSMKQDRTFTFNIIGKEQGSATS